MRHTFPLAFTQTQIFLGEGLCLLSQRTFWGNINNLCRYQLANNSKKSQQVFIRGKVFMREREREREVRERGRIVFLLNK
jgi:hypothetical protein